MVVLTDAQWAMLEPLVEACRPHAKVPPSDLRRTVESSVYVAAAHHGRGLGRLLLARLIDEAERRGFRQMVAVIGDSANLTSIRLHESLGFARVGTLRSVGWKHERWLDTVLMQRALGIGDGAPPDCPSRNDITSR